MHKQVTVDEHFITKLINSIKSPKTAIFEIIWNSLDADAKEIKIHISLNDLETVNFIKHFFQNLCHSSRMLPI